MRGGAIVQLCWGWGLLAEHDLRPWMLRFHNLGLVLVLNWTTCPLESTAPYRAGFQGHNYRLGRGRHHVCEHGGMLVEPWEWRGAVEVEGTLKWWLHFQDDAEAQQLKPKGVAPTL